MSREDPQLRIRLPIELKEKIEVAAKENTRSMNAEIVQRLEVSFLNDISANELISAEDAIRIANKAKDELANIIFKRTFSEINKKVRIGHMGFHINLTDLSLEGLDDDDFRSIFQQTFTRLKELGYSVSENNLDNDGFMVEIPKK